MFVEGTASTIDRQAEAHGIGPLIVIPYIF